MTRRSSSAMPDEGALVVAWTRRDVQGAGHWLRWQSPPVRTRADWQQAWQQAALWARNPGDAERRREVRCCRWTTGRSFITAGGAWSNPQRGRRHARQRRSAHARWRAPADQHQPGPGPGRAGHARLGEPLAGRRQVMTQAPPCAAQRRPRPRPPARRGLLAAMLTVTLVATFAACGPVAAVARGRGGDGRARPRAVGLDSGGRPRLVAPDPARGRHAGGADHLAEPWAVPLQEARLSTFLAADRNVAQVDDASTDTTDAFLSGQITDMQAA
jgi:hypothetical protein